MFVFTETFIPQDLLLFSSPEIKESIRHISFVDSLTGWAVCNKGLIYKTTDGTKTWVEQNSGVTADFTKVFFWDANFGWAATPNGTVAKTTDGGETWNSFNYGQASPNLIFSICDLVKFTDQNTGYIIAGKLKQIYLLKTTDGGDNWSIKDSLVSTTARRWYALDFNGNNGVMVGDKKDIQRYSTDGGDTWTPSTAIADNFFYMLKYVKWLNATDVIAIGEGNEFNGVILPSYKSTDGGITWTKKSQSFTTVYDRVKDAYFKNDLEGIGVGSDGFSKAFLIKTSDGGETWSNDVLDFAFGLSAIVGVENRLFALGTSSQIIISDDFGTTWRSSAKKTTSSIVNFSFAGGKGFAVTRNGDVLVSNDGTGKSWEYLSNAGKNNSGAMLFLQNEIGFILKESRHIVKSTDLGVTWQTVLEPVKPSSRNLIGGMDFGDNDHGYAWFSLSASDYGEYYVYNTTDGGNNWAQLKMFAGPGYISGNLISFDGNNAVLLGPDLWTQITTDGGATWNATTLIDFPVEFANRDFEDVAKIDENRAMAIGNGFICTTTDKGASWTYFNHGMNNIDSGFYKIAFSGDSLGYIALYSGVILKTTDMGTTWSKNETFYDQYSYFAASISPQGKAFFGTSNGYILGEEPPIVGINERELNLEFSMHQNYPNPFNPSTLIHYELKNPGNVQLKVFDMLGREVVELVNEFQTSGKYTVEFDVKKTVDKNLSSGVYIVQLRSNNQVQIIKASLIK